MPAFLALGLAWFLGGTLFEKTLAMRRIKPLPGPGPAVLVRLAMARKPVTMVAEFEPKSAVLLGASDLVEYHPELFGALVEALQGKKPGDLLIKSCEEY